MTDTVTIPLAEAAEKMKAIDTALTAAEANPTADTVAGARKAACAMLTAFNERASEQGAQPLDGGPKNPPPGS